MGSGIQEGVRGSMMGPGVSTGSGVRRPRTCEGKKSGKKRWMKEKTSTCPSGESGMMRMITKGMMVRRSLPMRRSNLTSRERRVYP